MYRWFLSASVALLTSALALAAQPPTFQGPIAGYVYDRASRTIRPLFGIPGSSYLGSPVLQEIASASVSPTGERAFLSKDGHAGFTRGFPEFSPDAVTGGLLDAIDRVAWSRDGTSAVLLSSSAGRLQRVRLSKDGALADTPVDLPASGKVTTMAIDPTGRQIAIGIAGSGLYVVDTDQVPALLLSTAQPAVAAFDNQGRLYAVDLDTQRIVGFRSGSGPIEFASLADPDSQALKPVGLAISGDGRYLALVDSVTSAVQVYDTESRTLTKTLRLSFVPSGLERLSPAPVFLLTGEGEGQLLLLDTRQEPQLYFVPAVRESTL